MRRADPVPNPPTIRQIEAAAQKAESAIGVLQRKLQAEQRQIRRQAFLDDDRALTPQEQQRLADIAATQQALTNALVQLSFVTLQNLDNSAQVQQLQGRMNQINQGLAGDLDRLKRIEAFAATVAKVADTIAQVATKLAALAAGAVI
jgi:hypothetical protein